MTKLKNLNCDKTWNMTNLNLNSLLVGTFLHLDNRWDVLWAAFCDSRDVFKGNNFKLDRVTPLVSPLWPQLMRKQFKIIVNYWWNMIYHCALLILNTKNPCVIMSYLVYRHYLYVGLHMPSLNYFFLHSFGVCLLQQVISVLPKDPNFHVQLALQY